VRRSSRRATDGLERWSPPTESGLQVCYGKTLHLQGFPISRLERRASPVHHAVPGEGRESGHARPQPGVQCGIRRAGFADRVRSDSRLLHGEPSGRAMEAVPSAYGLPWLPRGCSPDRPASARHGVVSSRRRPVRRALERLREHHLRDLVHRPGVVTRRLRLDRGHVLVRLPAHQMRARAPETDSSFHFFVAGSSPS
jgi:hypothetical protein